MVSTSQATISKVDVHDVYLMITWSNGQIQVVTATELSNLHDGGKIIMAHRMSYVSDEVRSYCI